IRKSDFGIRGNGFLYKGKEIRIGGGDNVIMGEMMMETLEMVREREVSSKGLDVRGLCVGVRRRRAIAM
ncbi:hypothetical protein, partial [Bacillus altitudinis]|uniref:hypothetical protein n=1 Tax=Bacillus altitudinis TaxID=293387 RepID=UPI001C92C8DC